MNTLERAPSLSSKNKTEYDHTKTLEEVDTYNDGVFAVLALIHEARWDPEGRALRAGVKFEVGRRMTTSEGNRVSPDTNVTPDCVIQVDPRNGLVAEAKLSLPRDDTQWDSNFTQIEKYDDDLIGWWTADEKIETHDIVTLVPLPRAVKFADRLEEGIDQAKWRFDREVSVIGFFKVSGVSDFLTLKKEWGKLSDSRLDSRLRESVPINFAHLLSEYKDRKFVDSEPPLPYLLQIIWDNLFVQYASATSPDPSGTSVQIETSVEALTRDLQEYYGFKSSGHRSPEIPRMKFVKKALDALVDFRLAEMMSAGVYRINYKRGKVDTLKKFGRLCSKRDLQARKTSGRSTTNPSLPGMS